MYPLPGESEEDFMKRLAILCKKRRAEMTPEELKIAGLLANGEMTPEIKKTLIVKED